jgi:NAD+ dependent glucose-6-phosphate dehydrogenase
MINVLVTGAYGLIGNLVYARLAGQPDRYDVFGTSRRPGPSQRAEGIETYPIPPAKLRISDLTDFEAVQRAVQGMDVVVHMAADPSGAEGWESILNNNIVGSYHLFEACRLAGVRRVLYASSNQVAFGYFDFKIYQALRAGHINPKDFAAPRPVHHTQPARPLNLYSCSKVFGEGLAHMYAQTHNLSCIVLRIGWVLAEDRPPSPLGGGLWCSQRDCVQLVELAINAPGSLRFDVFFVQSENANNLVDIQHAKDVLGYAPQDSAE